jgi:dihydroneopterin aldolase
VVEEMAIRFNSIGACGTTNNNEDFFKHTCCFKILLSKLNPPIGGDVEAVTIELDEYRS